jgi:phosphoenolpyruvate carboxylase
MDFLTYWSEATPIDALERAAIGSRPSRRSGRKALDDLRAIPWVFSWNQARHYLPGWYGIGAGLAVLKKLHPDDFALLARESSRWPFLRNALYNAETSLASAAPDLMADYASLVEDKTVRDHILGIILAEHELAGRMIDEVFAARREVRRPRMLATITPARRRTTPPACAPDSPHARMARVPRRRRRSQGGGTSPDRAALRQRHRERVARVGVMG